MRQVTDVLKAGHSRATLQGMQLALQLGDGLAVVVIGLPLLQGIVACIHDLHGLFQEDLDQLHILLARHVGLFFAHNARHYRFDGELRCRLLNRCRFLDGFGNGLLDSRRRLTGRGGCCLRQQLFSLRGQLFAGGHVGTRLTQRLEHHVGVINAVLEQRQGQARQRLRVDLSVFRVAL